MKTELVSDLPAIDRFLYWIRERHKIYKKRKAGKPKPWTDDEVLQQYFFTHPYRENDKTTVWFRENIRKPLRDDPRVLFATVCFRWFNKTETGYHLKNNRLLVGWDKELAVSVLRHLKDLGRAVFTGAYMIPGKPGKGKIEHVCDCLQPIWEDCNRADCKLQRRIEGWNNLEDACKYLQSYPWLGGFMAYEIVTDLRHTYLLENATDIETWCNPGPGCARGLLRMEGQDLSDLPAGKGCRPPKDWLTKMRELLKIAQRRLRSYPYLEMREIEHSLCEWDKYERARLGQGRMKRKYQGT